MRNHSETHGHQVSVQRLTTMILMMTTMEDYDKDNNENHRMMMTDHDGNDYDRP
jgi:hypothetical protein